MATNKKRWYAVRVLAGKEREALKNLEKEIELNKISEWVGEVILPIQKQQKLRNGKRVTQDKLMMPGYLFVEAQLIGEVERTIKRTKNITGFTGDRSNRPIPIQKHEIERIVGSIEESEKSITEIPFIVDEDIVVIDGPFNSFKGKVSSIDHDKQMLDVIVKIFGRETPVKLSYMQVDKA